VADPDGQRLRGRAILATREERLQVLLEAASSADYVTFTSSSTVRNFVAAVGGGFPERARVVSIGPVTSEAAREAGLTVDLEAESHDLDGLVEALVADAMSRTVPG